MCSGPILRRTQPMLALSALVREFCRFRGKFALFDSGQFRQISEDVGHCRSTSTNWWGGFRPIGGGDLDQMWDEGRPWPSHGRLGAADFRLPFCGTPPAPRSRGWGSTSPCTSIGPGLCDDHTSANGPRPSDERFPAKRPVSCSPNFDGRDKIALGVCIPVIGAQVQMDGRSSSEFRVFVQLAWRNFDAKRPLWLVKVRWPQKPQALHPAVLRRSGGDSPPRRAYPPETRPWPRSGGDELGILPDSRADQKGAGVLRPCSGGARGGETRSRESCGALQTERQCLGSGHPCQLGQRRWDERCAQDHATRQSQQADFVARVLRCVPKPDLPRTSWFMYSDG